MLRSLRVALHEARATSAEIAAVAGGAIVLASVAGVPLPVHIRQVPAYTFLVGACVLADAALVAVRDVSPVLVRTASAGRLATVWRCGLVVALLCVTLAPFSGSDTGTALLRNCGLMVGAAWTAGAVHRVAGHLAPWVWTFASVAAGMPAGGSPRPHWWAIPISPAPGTWGTVAVLLTLGTAAVGARRLARH